MMTKTSQRKHFRLEVAVEARRFYLSRTSLHCCHQHLLSNLCYALKVLSFVARYSKEMQSAREHYGLTDMQQFIVGRGAPAQIFAVSADNGPASLQHHPYLHLHNQHDHHLPNHHQQQQIELLQLYQHHGLPEEQQSIEFNHFRTQAAPQQQASTLFNLHPQKQSLDVSMHIPLSVPGAPGISEAPDMPSPLATGGSAYAAQTFRSLFGAPTKEPSIGEEDNEFPDDGDRGLGGSRWPRDETLALLRIRSEMDSTFKESALKAPLWEEVSRKLSELGYHRSAKKCKEKFENVQKYYKKTKDGRSGRQEGRTYRFCSELDAIYAASNDLENGADAGAPVNSDGDNTNNIQVEQTLFGGGFLPPFSMSMEVFKKDPNSASLVSSGENYSNDENEQQPMQDSEDVEVEALGKKRKRKSWRSMKNFFENLAKRIMEQQDSLHRKFLEAIEKRDNERIAREEAHKRQEMARLRREQELRAQENELAAARDAALVAFLQKVTGETVQLPQALLTQAAAVPPAHPAAQVHNTSISTPNNSTDNKQYSDDSLQYQMERDDGVCNTSNSRRWPKVEVLALIRVRTSLEPRFQEAGPKSQLWEEVSVSMACMGFVRSAKRCKEKWENINKYFRKTKDSSRKRHSNPKTCPYFHQLEALYNKGVLSAPCSAAPNKLPRDAAHNCSSDNTNDLRLQPVPCKEDNVRPMISHFESHSLPMNMSASGPSYQSHNPAFTNDVQSNLSAGNVQERHQLVHVRDMLEFHHHHHLQQHHVQERKLVEDFRTQEEGSEGPGEPHEQSTLPACTLSSQDSATLMALVQKLAGHSDGPHQFNLSSNSSGQPPTERGDVHHHEADDERNGENPTDV